MGKPKKAGRRKTEYLAKPLFAETALDPNHEHYWGLKRAYKRYYIIRCQVCGLEERRKVNWDKVPTGEVPDV